ncbi:MAG: hypothetical protein SP1CHLAM54_14390 [Chlamydiia bacterium]|nr:hypothetical protein [Chlamydiia bacterium]MCH9616331.1 hypothetical protein [Chlamydiia bacterium]MCH9629683.1 hypothetical protein [Chlamydiia bacterium]
MKYAAVCDGRNPHFLDHFAPLECPILTDQENLLAYKHLYPNLDLRLIQSIEDYRAYDYLITSSKNAGPELTALTGVPHIFLPHGHSDKPPTIFEPQHRTFIYGPAMENQIAHLNLPKIPLPNIRYAYYLKHQTFFDNLLPITQEVALYAPTWCNLSTFKTHFNHFLKKPLIIKCHPFLEQTHPSHVIYLEELAKTHKNLHVFTHFPLYPLMAHSNQLITDASSVGYEYLTFNRPIYLTSPSNTPLATCSYQLHEALNEEKFAPKREKLLHKTHYNSLNPSDLFQCKAALHL